MIVLSARAPLGSRALGVAVACLLALCVAASGPTPDIDLEPAWAVLVVLVAAPRLRTGEQARSGQPWRPNGSRGAALPTGVVARVPELRSLPLRHPTEGRRRLPRVTLAALVVAAAAFVVLAAGSWTTCVESVPGWPYDGINPLSGGCPTLPEAEGGVASWLGFGGWLAVMSVALLLAAAAAAMNRRR